MSRRTLVVHTGALGDFLLTCPAIEFLARDGEVELCGHPDRHALGVAAGIAARAHPLDALNLHKVLAATGQACTPAVPPPDFAQFVQRFERAVIWMRDPGGVIERAFRAAGVNDVRCCPGLPQADWPGHASAYYLDTVGAPPIETYCLRFPPVPGLDVVIAPGSGSPKKNWPLEHFVALAQALERQGRRIAWLLGPAEEAIALSGSYCVLRTPDLTTLAGLLTAAKQFIGNDSGVTHLASMCGCPTLALFGPTNPIQWRPIGVDACILSGAGWPAVSQVVEKLFAASSSSFNER